MVPPGGGKELEGPLALRSLGGWPGLGSLEDIPDGGKVLTKIVPREASREGTLTFVQHWLEREVWVEGLPLLPCPRNHGPLWTLLFLCFVLL